MEAAVKNEAISAGDLLKVVTGGVILVGGSAFLIRYFIKKSFENIEQNKSLDDGSAATYAKQLKMAFDNDSIPGTNMTEVRRIFQEIPTQAVFNEVEKSYQRQYNTPLAKDLESELKSSEYSEMLSIKAAKPQKAKLNKAEKLQLAIAQRMQWAKRFKAAFQYSWGPFPATDVDAIKAILYELPTQQMFADIAVIYEKLYHTKLMQDIKKALHFWDYNTCIDIIKKKPLK